MSDGIRSYKQTKVDGAAKAGWDAIFVGSGISCMTGAAILAKEGARVLILERHYTAGGFTHVFKRNGYEWDVGIHYIGGVTHEKALLHNMFHYITDGELEWEDMGEVYDIIRFGDEDFAFRKKPENLKADLKGWFPETADQRAIEQYFDLVKQANKVSTNFFAEKALPQVMAKVAGGRMRKEFLKFASQTTREVLEELTDNQKLIGVLTGQYGDYGLPPGQSSFAMHALLVNHYFYGAGFPRGGSAEIANNVAKVIAKAGGMILTNASVDEIIVNNNYAKGVRLEDGSEIFAPLVISGAGVFNTYQKMLPDSVQTQFKLETKLEKVEPSVAHLGLYIGFQESTDALGLQKANYWIYPEGGYDHDENVRRFVDGETDDFPVVYVSFPSAKDPDWDRRYPGRATVDIITLAPYEWFRKWEDSKWKRRGEEYDAFKERLSQRLLEVLYRYEPQLRGKVDHYELSTPLSTRDFVNYGKGEIYGLNHDPDRFEQDFLRPHTPIKNLYLTGQDIVTAGIGGAMMAGVLTISAIKKRNYINKIRESVKADLAR